MLQKEKSKKIFVFDLNGIKAVEREDLDKYNVPEINQRGLKEIVPPNERPNNHDCFNFVMADDFFTHNSSEEDSGGDLMDMLADYDANYLDNFSSGDSGHSGRSFADDVIDYLIIANEDY